LAVGSAAAVPGSGVAAGVAEAAGERAADHDRHVVGAARARARGRGTQAGDDPMLDVVGKHLVGDEMDGPVVIELGRPEPDDVPVEQRCRAAHDHAGGDCCHGRISALAQIQPYDWPAFVRRWLLRSSRPRAYMRIFE